jgi:hypothetical protein
MILANFYPRFVCLLMRFIVVLKFKSILDLVGLNYPMRMLFPSQIQFFVSFLISLMLTRHFLIQIINFKIP